MRPSIRLLRLLCLLLPLNALAEKTDVVTLKNGDRITGEVVKLEAGVMEYKTDFMGTIQIEWRAISTLVSRQSFSVETSDGRRILGNLLAPDAQEYLLVNTVRGPVGVPRTEIVSAWPVESTFLERMNLDLSVGFDYTKATDIVGFNLAGDLAVRGNDRLTEFSLRSNITILDEGEDQRRWDLKGAHEYLLPEQRFRSWFVRAESNDAVGVDLRLSGGGAFGKYLIKTNNNWFSVAAGLNASQEAPSEGESETNLELIGNLRYRYFRFAGPERSLDANFSVFPSLTDSGRWRGDLRTTFKLELVTDLFWALELYATYDNQPLTEGAENSDYGVITSLGWSY